MAAFSSSLMVFLVSKKGFTTRMDILKSLGSLSTSIPNVMSYPGTCSLSGRMLSKRMLSSSQRMIISTAVKLIKHLLGSLGQQIRGAIAGERKLKDIGASISGYIVDAVVIVIGSLSEEDISIGRGGKGLKKVLLQIGPEDLEDNWVRGTIGHHLG